MTPNRWRRLGTLAALVAGLACHVHSRAADGSAGVPLPGLVSEPKGSVRALSAEVDLAGDAVVLRLELRTSGVSSSADDRRIAASSACNARSSIGNLSVGEGGAAVRARNDYFTRGRARVRASAP